jgi:hypothetical protein
VRLDVQNNAIKNSSLIFNAKQQTLIDNSKKQFQENPIFSESNPNSKRNKEIYVQKLADMGYDKKVISDQLGVEYDPNSAESVVNSIINIPTKIELSLPRAKLAVMDILVDFATQPLIGERNTVDDRIIRGSDSVVLRGGKCGRICKYEIKTRIVFQGFVKVEFHGGVH